MTLGVERVRPRRGQIPRSRCRITSGPFRFTRNPLYISLALVYAGIALTVGSAWALAFLVPVLGIIRYGVIAREERYLEGKFGPEYLRYKQSVRRWL